MSDLPNGFAVFAAMLGFDAGVLHAISAPWVADPNHAPITPMESVRLLEDAQHVAGQLNNTDAWEQAITGAFSPDETLRTLHECGAGFILIPVSSLSPPCLRRYGFSPPPEAGFFSGGAHGLRSPAATQRVCV